MEIKEFEYNERLEPTDKLKWYRVLIKPLLVDVQAESEDHALDRVYLEINKAKLDLEFEITEIQTIDESGRA